MRSSPLGSPTLFLFLVIVKGVFCFTVISSLPSHARGKYQQSRSQPSISWPDSCTILQESFSLAEEEKTVEAFTLQDANGKEFSLGCVVRVSQEVKAYQLPSMGQGSYDAKKQFIPNGGDQRYLLVPAGLRGTVTKIYDEDDVSANLPIQVKFVPGEHTDEEVYDPPVRFTMHFSPEEVEVV